MSSKHWIRKSRTALEKNRITNGRLRDRYISIAEHFAGKALDTAKTGKEYKAVNKLLKDIADASII